MENVQILNYIGNSKKKIIDKRKTVLSPKKKKTEVGTGQNLKYGLNASDNETLTFSDCQDSDSGCARYLEKNTWL